MALNHESHEVFEQYGISEDTLYPRVKLLTSSINSTKIDPIMIAINLQKKVYGETPDINISKINRFTTAISRRGIDEDVLVETFGNKEAGAEYVKSKLPSGFMVEVFTGGAWNIKVAAKTDKDSERKFNQLQHFDSTGEEGINQLSETWPVLTITNDGKLELSSKDAFTMRISKSEASVSEPKWEKKSIFFSAYDIYPSLVPNDSIEAEVGVLIRNFDVQEMIARFGEGIRQRQLTLEDLSSYVKPYILLHEQSKV